MRKMIFILLAGVLVMPIFALALTASPVSAVAPTENDYWGGSAVSENIEGNILLGNKDPREITARVINIILGFLGIIAVVIILAGGFKWMTAGGNQDKIDEAKKLMAAGAIGLVIVLASFGIARFLVESLRTATTV